MNDNSSCHFPRQIAFKYLLRHMVRGLGCNILSGAPVLVSSFQILSPMATRLQILLTLYYVVTFPCLVLSGLAAFACVARIVDELFEHFRLVDAYDDYQQCSNALDADFL